MTLFFALSSGYTNRIFAFQEKMFSLLRNLILLRILFTNLQKGKIGKDAYINLFSLGNQDSNDSDAQ